MAQLGQSLGLELADSLPGDLEVGPNFLEGPHPTIGEAEPHDQHLPLPVVETLQSPSQLILKRAESRDVGRPLRIHVLDHVAEGAVIVLPHRRLQRDGVLGDPLQLQDARDLKI